MENPATPLRFMHQRPAPGLQAFVWDATNGMRGLGDLPGGSLSSSAQGVSADGTVIVGSSNGEAFIWDATNGMQRLSVLLTSLGIDLSGLQLTGAVGISADGRTIVGNARSANGDEGWIAVIFESN